MSACISDRCQQGRKSCATPLICSQGLHRVNFIDTPPVTAENTGAVAWIFIECCVGFLAVMALSTAFYIAWFS